MRTGGHNSTRDHENVKSELFMKTKRLNKTEIAKRETLRYLNRRQVLGAGLLAPWTISSLLSETSAFGEISGNGRATYPVVQIHLQGGWGGAVLPLDSNGNPLTNSALGRYGVQPSILSQSGTIQSLFGLQYFDRTLDKATTPVLDFTQGLIQKLPNPSNVQAFTIANNSQDDNNTNPLGVNAVLLAGGFKADLVDAVGLSRTTSGMTNTSVLSSFKSTPFIAPGPTDLQNLFSYAPALAGRSESILANFANALRNIGNVQAPRVFEKAKEKDQLVNGVNSAHNDNIKFTVPNNTIIDATQDAAYVSAFSNLFAANQALSANPQLATFATALKGLLMGYIHFVGYSIPFGYDYHGQNVLDNGNTLGTQSRDRIAGQLLGTIMSLALTAGKNLILVLTSDGACQGLPDHTIGSGGVNSNLWTGDRGQQNLMHFYAVNGAGSNLNRFNGKMQVGSMKADTGTVDTSTLSGKNDMAAGNVLAANILHLNGVPDAHILQILPAFGSTATLQEHLILRL